MIIILYDLDKLEQTGFQKPGFYKVFLDLYHVVFNLGIGNCAVPVAYWYGPAYQIKIHSFDFND